VCRLEQVALSAAALALAVLVVVEAAQLRGECRCSTSSLSPGARGGTSASIRNRSVQRGAPDESLCAAAVSVPHRAVSHSLLEILCLFRNSIKFLIHLLDSFSRYFQFRTNTTKDSLFDE